MYISTGELSERLNVSVRTIRYYDQIGLVHPTKLGEGGKRYYSREDSLKLEKVILLKTLSLKLGEIERIIKEQSTESILIAHRAHLNDQIDILSQSIASTNSLINVIKLEESIDWGELLNSIVPKPNKRNWNTYFTEKEKDFLQHRLPKLEEDSLITKKWINIIKRIEICINEGLSPKSMHGTLIKNDIDYLSEETFEGNLELTNKFWEVRRSQETSSSLNLYAIKPEIIDFIEKIYE